MDEATMGAITRLRLAIDIWLGMVGVALDIFGVLVIVGGIAWATYWFARRHSGIEHVERFKIRIGRALLLGLEILVAADIIKTIAVEPTQTGLLVLGGLVVLRTFLSWSLFLEIEGRWPWQTRGARPKVGAEQ